MTRNGSAERANTKEKSAGNSLHRFIPLVVIVALLVDGYVAGLHKYISLETLIREHETLKAWVDGHLLGAIASYLAIYIAAVAVSFPGASLLTIVGGFLFGVVLGTVLTVVGATLGASVIFMVAKTSLGSALRARAGQFAEKLARGFEANAFSYLL
ncbi:MAG: TVP38/TMEM64 family protein, partial [Pseudomonadota bacterium]